MAYFMAWGFSFAYLLTRLWMPKALTRAEREEAVRKREVEKDDELRILERRVYDYLYQAPPGGFTRAIEAIEAYHGKPGSLRSAWLWTYLACAYGQKHASEKKRTGQDDPTLRERVREAVVQALSLDAGVRPILEQVYRGADPNEDDLASLKPDEQLERLLG